MLFFFRFFSPLLFFFFSFHLIHAGHRCENGVSHPLKYIRSIKALSDDTRNHYIPPPPPPSYLNRWYKKKKSPVLFLIPRKFQTLKRKFQCRGIKHATNLWWWYRSSNYKLMNHTYWNRRKIWIKYSSKKQTALNSQILQVNSQRVRYVDGCTIRI